MISRPLVIDLDGTLLFTDMLHESAIRVVGSQPWMLFRLPVWLSKGKSRLKAALSDRFDVDVKNLPYNLELVDWLKKQKASGRKLVLCTATHIDIAERIAEHIGLFDDVFASNNDTNLAGEKKATFLQQKYGDKGFDYIGNSSDDLSVWKVSNQGVVVNASKSVTQKAQLLTDVVKTFPNPHRKILSWGKAIRAHQWLKNLLLFVPLLAAHQFFNLGAWSSLIMAFFAFSLCASSVYIFNDLLDLDSDRRHQRKKYRPFASGAIPIHMGIVVGPLLLLTSIIIANMIFGSFHYWLYLYFATTCAYSWFLKQILLVDCITLAVLYTLRILAGASVAFTEVTYWLLNFSIFLFLSLAFVKRYAEIMVQKNKGKNKTHGRAYLASDAPIVQMLGIASGYASILVLSLYLNTEKVFKMYQAPEYIWGAVMAMLFWISWIWMQAHRGNMHDDPLVFAATDKASICAGLVFAVVLGLGAKGLSW